MRGGAQSLQPGRVRQARREEVDAGWNQVTSLVIGVNEILQ